MKKLISKSFLSLIFIFCFQQIILGQEIKQQLIEANLLQNSNSIVLDYQTTIEIDAYNKMQITKEKEILVLNSKGFNDVDAYEHYDKVSKVKDIEVEILAVSGDEIDKIKKRNFTDVSAVSSGTLYSNSRVYYLDYTPRSYPLKVKYKSVVKTTNTAFIKSFSPISNYYQSVKSYTFTIINNSEASLRFHKNELAREKVEEEIKENSYQFKIANLEALTKEPYSPSLKKLSPQIKFALSKFELKGVAGEVSNWQEFGDWKNENLLKDVNQLPKKTIAMVEDLVKDLDTNEEKARAIYEYVQENTRYISLQIGIGGWKPITALEVDDTKYGDCKGLTNYTKSLLEVVGIPSNYCVVYAGNSPDDIEEDFASMQGNHAILQIPLEDEEIWLECTSQKIPFNFLGKFTDNRKVIAVGNEGGKILTTPAYLEEDNKLVTQAYIDVENLDLKAKIHIKTTGTQYQDHYNLDFKSPKEVKKHYQKYWSHLQKLDVVSYHFSNNKKDIEFNEDVEVVAENYIKKYGNDYIFDVNPFNKINFNLTKTENRRNPFTVERGFVDEDVFEFNMGRLQLETLPENVLIENQFGVYQLNFEWKDGIFSVHRYVKLNKNEYQQSDYNSFVDFTRNIENHDQTKVSFKI